MLLVAKHPVISLRKFFSFKGLDYYIGTELVCVYFVSGECLVYGFDDLSGALQLSHRLVLSSKDYPGILFMFR